MNEKETLKGFIPSPGTTISGSGSSEERMLALKGFIGGRRSR